MPTFLQFDPPWKVHGGQIVTYGCRRENFFCKAHLHRTSSTANKCFAWKDSFACSPTNSMMTAIGYKRTFLRTRSYVRLRVISRRSYYPHDVTRVMTIILTYHAKKLAERLCHLCRGLGSAKSLKAIFRLLRPC